MFSFRHNSLILNQSFLYANYKHLSIFVTIHAFTSWASTSCECMYVCIERAYNSKQIPKLEIFPQIQMWFNFKKIQFHLRNTYSWKINELSFFANTPKLNSNLKRFAFLYFSLAKDQFYSQSSPQLASTQSSNWFTSSSLTPLYESIHRTYIPCSLTSSILLLPCLLHTMPCHIPSLARNSTSSFSSSQF